MSSWRAFSIVCLLVALGLLVTPWLLLLSAAVSFWVLPMTSLNAAVTAAILDAERAPTRKKWLLVADLERQLSEQAETEVEREIARMGIETALASARECDQ